MPKLQHPPARELDHRLQFAMAALADAIECVEELAGLPDTDHGRLYRDRAELRYIVDTLRDIRGNIPEVEQ
ncbi:hypothetical protein [Mycolicibacter arupensis]|uniref:Uncharacterized protein n=1 Tax=Mycolicibacter arupensis TaxID=342002 RepID=A0A5C7XY85_9MYCO|nr:hypothetical protein [Mycolicibacter arupensis]TXI54296.1 MAG: hypothetical protein E6Q54_15080 [Mycolicibacter arupensis]